MQVQVNEECVGCGACESLYPGGFEVVEGKSEAKDCLDISTDDARDAADRCPQGAIQVEEGSSPGDGAEAEVSLSEVLERADEAGIAGADVWVERVGGSGGVAPSAPSKAQEKSTGSPSPSSSKSKNKSTSKSSSRSGETGGGRNLGQMMIQIGVVAVIVIASAYLAFG